MDFGAFPPEINSGRMYAGPGAGSMLAAASAWDGLAAELHSTAAAAGSVVSGLTGESWQGVSSTSMAAAVAPYLTWMTATATQLEEVANQARMASAFCCGAAASGTTASENPCRYWRTEYSHTPVPIVATKATASNELLSHHAQRNRARAFNLILGLRELNCPMTRRALQASNRVALIAGAAVPS